MKDPNEEIGRFLSACDELIDSMFILADGKISELLKTIAASEELTGLFQAVTEGYDYEGAKKRYLRYPAEPHSARGAAYLPTDRREILAFVFCLLVEFDSGSMRFSDFLLRYFYEDGSYTASYTLFAARLIRPFRDIVRDCFPDPVGGESMQTLRRREDEILAALSEKLTVERARINAFGLSQEDTVAGDMILAEMIASVARRDVTELKALLCGYLYFLSAMQASTIESREIFSLAAELV